MAHTVLVIDDYELNIKLVEDFLRHSGYQVVSAYNAEDGIKLAHKYKPDVILMDLRISGAGMDGWTATRAIRQDRELSHVPVIALSAEVKIGDKRRAFEAGCDAFITKPFNIFELQTVIRQHLQVNA